MDRVDCVTGAIFSFSTHKKMLALASVFAAAECHPIQDLVFCRNELSDLSDLLRFTTLQNPGYEDLFEVGGVHVADTLDVLAAQLETNFGACPCIDTCTKLDECMDDSTSLA